MVPEIRRKTDKVFCHFGPFFALLPPLTTWKIFKKMERASWDVIILHMCTKNHYHMMFATWDMECERHNFLSFWAIFCPFTPKLISYIKIWKKCKNPFTQVYHKWKSNDIWFLRYKAQQTELFVILDHFSHFDRPNPKNQSFEKIKKTPEDILILHLCTTNDNHMMYVFGDMERDRKNVLSFWTVILLSVTTSCISMAFIMEIMIAASYIYTIIYVLRIRYMNSDILIVFYYSYYNVPCSNVLCSIFYVLMFYFLVFYVLVFHILCSNVLFFSVLF